MLARHRPEGPSSLVADSFAPELSGHDQGRALPWKSLIIMRHGSESFEHWSLALP